MMKQNIVIAGLGKSGTTALFYKIKKNMPDKEVINLFEPKNYNYVNEDLPILAKIAFGEEDISYNGFDLFEKKIIITRDPRDIIISALLYGAGYHKLWNKRVQEIISAVNLLKNKTQNPRSVSLIELWKRLRGISSNEVLSKELSARFERFLRFSRDSKGYFIFRYEDMIMNRFQELESYLGFDLSNKEVIDKRYSHVKRSATKDNWRNWFTDADIIFF